MRKVCRMWLHSIGIVLAATTVVAQAPPKAPEPDSTQAAIVRALSAAPAAVSARAAVAEMDDSGHLTMIRSGDNGWTCLPHDPGTPLGHPLCLDRNGLTWLEAAMTGKAPGPALVGYSYMLRGGSVWSNTDPTAMALPAGEKSYVTIPPHFMVFNARLAHGSGFPSGEAHPDTHKPFVMYGGTPFALLIFPME